MTKKQIFYLGPKTSYTDVAKETLIKEFNLEGYEDIEKPTITAVVNELCKSSEDSLAVVPIENSIEGIVKESIDNVSRVNNSGIKIMAECIIPINHCFISYAEKIEDVKTIISHPQAISQCFDYIYGIFGDKIVYKTESSTANAVKNITKDDKTVCAIGSKYSANYYNKPVVKENINDEKYNQTRFLLLGKSKVATKKNRL